TRDDEEDVNPDVAAADPGDPGVKQHDGHYCDGAQAFDVWPKRSRWRLWSRLRRVGRADGAG
ncbi:MAG: hypothetical protein QOI33_2886, partial [Mycobacterium sp.]|nr:hypothetical protein [Mycobacterium sp.]